MNWFNRIQQVRYHSDDVAGRKSDCTRKRLVTFSEILGGEGLGDGRERHIVKNCLCVCCISHRVLSVGSESARGGVIRRVDR